MKPATPNPLDPDFLAWQARRDLERRAERAAAASVRAATRLQEDWDKFTGVAAE